MFMRTLILCLVTLLISCDKEMPATHQRYSFLRLNEDGFNIPSCMPEVNLCLPIISLDDLSFQLITDYTESISKNQLRFTIALPCQDNEVDLQEIKDDIFSGTIQDITLVGSSSGMLTYISAPVNPLPSIGDYVFIQMTVTSGTDVRGIHKVINVVAGTVYTNAILTSGLPTWSCAKVQILQGEYILGLEAEPIPDNAEYAGKNYLWHMEKYLSTDIPYTVGECFRFCVWKIVLDVNLGCNGVSTNSQSEYLGSSNCFKVVDASCYSSKVTYSADEPAFGFYGEGWTNSIRLPVYVSRPQFPGEEKGYQKSTGEFIKLSERINKEWEFKTDWMPEEWHQYLRMALSCDNVYITNEFANLTNERIYKKEEYDIEWDEDRDFYLAKGKCKVFKTLLSKSVNSNCV